MNAADAVVAGRGMARLDGGGLDRPVAVLRVVALAKRDAAGPGARLVALSGAWQTWSDATAAEAQS